LDAVVPVDFATVLSRAQVVRLWHCLERQSMAPADTESHNFSCSIKKNLS